MNRCLLVLFLLLGHLGLSQDTLTVYFDFDEAIVKPADITSLQGLNIDPNKGTLEIITLIAHTDTSGSVAYNNELAERRLNAVLNVLQIESGTSKSLVLGETEANRSSNYDAARFRKVDVIYSVKEYISETSIPAAEPILTDQEKLNQELNLFLKDSTSEVLIQLSVNFYPGRAILLEGEEEELYTLYRFLRTYSSVKAKIRGHVCCGSNMALSQNRAYVVYEYLVGKGISPSRLTHRGYDNSQPFIFPEETEEDKAKNRRVDVIFTK